MYYYKALLISGFIKTVDLFNFFQNNTAKMKFLQFKYLAFYPALLIILYTIVKDIQNWHIPAYPMFMFTGPIILVYLIIALSYYFLKSRKGLHRYINGAIDFGILNLIIYTICIFLFSESDHLIFKSIFIAGFVFTYQFLVVLYSVIIGIAISYKNLDA